MTDDMFKKLVKQRQKTESKTPAPEQSVESNQSKEIPTTAEPKKRGRPAKGKRSDPDWIGRTYYIRKQTDLDVEEELLRLKREGVELDKSELVDAMLEAWVKWRQGENIDLRIAEFSPRRNVDK